MMNTKILTLICFGIIVSSMFLPFYEGPRMNGIVPEDSFVIYEVFDSPEFGLKMWVFNGFGSLFAWTNLLLSLILVFSRFFFPRSFATAISSAAVFVISLGLLIYGTSDKPGVLLADEMRIGFYLVLISQVILITQSFTSAITAPQKDRKHDPDLLDF